MTNAQRPLACDTDDGECRLCGDVGNVGRVIDIDETGRTGIIAFAEEHATVALDLVDVRVGDQVLVHLGFAIEKVDRDE